MKVISPLDGGGQEVILTLIQGGCNFKGYFANFRTPPPDNYCTVPYALKLSHFNNISNMNSPLVPKDDQFLQSLPLKHVHLCNAALSLMHAY